MTRTATQAYDENIQQARAHIRNILIGIADHTVDAVRKDNLDWGHVGDMAHLVECLKTAEEAICGGSK